MAGDEGTEPGPTVFLERPATTRGVAHRLQSVRSPCSASAATHACVTRLHHASSSDPRAARERGTVDVHSAAPGQRGTVLAKTLLPRDPIWGLRVHRLDSGDISSTTDVSLQDAREVTMRAIQQKESPLITLLLVSLALASCERGDSPVQSESA